MELSTTTTVHHRKKKKHGWLKRRDSEKITGLSSHFAQLCLLFVTNCCIALLLCHWQCHCHVVVKNNVSTLMANNLSFLLCHWHCHCHVVVKNNVWTLRANNLSLLWTTKQVVTCRGTHALLSRHVTWHEKSHTSPVRLLLLLILMKLLLLTKLLLLLLLERLKLCNVYGNADVILGIIAMY